MRSMMPKWMLASVVMMLVLVPSVCEADDIGLQLLSANFQESTTGAYYSFPYSKGDEGSSFSLQTYTKASVRADNGDDPSQDAYVSWDIIFLVLNEYRFSPNSYFTSFDSGSVYAHSGGWAKASANGILTGSIYINNRLVDTLSYSTPANCNTYDTGCTAGPYKLQDDFNKQYTLDKGSILEITGKAESYAGVNTTCFFWTCSEADATATNNSEVFLMRPIPEPGTLFLFGSIILGLAGVFRRKIEF